MIAEYQCTMPCDNLLSSLRPVSHCGTKPSLTGAKHGRLVGSRFADPRRNCHRLVRIERCNKFWRHSGNGFAGFDRAYRCGTGVLAEPVDSPPRPADEASLVATAPQAREPARRGLLCSVFVPSSSSSQRRNNLSSGVRGRQGSGGSTNPLALPRLLCRRPEHHGNRRDGPDDLTGRLEFACRRVDRELDDGIALLIGDVKPTAARVDDEVARE
jgi:hypothetical protein